MKATTRVSFTQNERIICPPFSRVLNLIGRRFLGALAKTPPEWLAPSITLCGLAKLECPTKLKANEPTNQLAEGLRWVEIDGVNRHNVILIHPVFWKVINQRHQNGISSGQSKMISKTCEESQVRRITSHETLEGELKMAIGKSSKSHFF